MAIGNLLEQEDMAKGLPDDVLMREAEQPSGQLPQFLLISEVKRRADMRKRYQLQMQEMEPTVAEQIMQEGITGVAQPPPEMQQAMNGGPPLMQPSMNGGPPPMAGPPQQPPPQMAYQAGGVVGMQGGREVPAQITDSMADKIPNVFIQDALKYSPDPSDQEAGQTAMMQTKDMGIPTVVDEKDGKSNIVRNLLGMASNLRQKLGPTPFVSRHNPGDIINFAEDSERRNIANSNNSPRVMTVAELEIIANKSNRSDEKKNSGGGVVKMNKGGLLDTEGGLLDTYITKMGDLFGKTTTPPDYSELIDIASNTKDDKLAIALTSIGAAIASGEGFAKGAKEATDRISEMNKEKRNAITALRLAQLRGASEAEIADLTRDVAIAGEMLRAIPKPVTPEARSELQKTLASMDELEKSGQTNTEKYRLLQARAKTIATKAASMSEIQGEVIGPIQKLIAAGKKLTEGQNKVYQDWLNLAFLERIQSQTPRF
jgi:hypothetical protein